MKNVSFKSYLNFQGFKHILEALERYNNLNDLSEIDFITLFHGSKLSDLVMARMLKEVFNDCISYFENMGVVYCYLDIEEFLHLNGAIQENIDYQLYMREVHHELYFMDYQEEYNNSEFSLLKETLESLDIYESDNNFCEAANWILDNCVFYTDYIDFDDDDLMAHLDYVAG